MSVKLTWHLNNETENIAGYHIERSFIGVVTTNTAPFNIPIGSNMKVRVDGGNLVTITFNAITNGAATAEQVATIINGTLQPYGGSARVNFWGNRVIIQSNRQNDRGSLNIKSGTALSGLGIVAGVRRFQSEYEEIGAVDYATNTFEDKNGDDGYQYRISAENNDGYYSEPSQWFSAFKEVIPTSVIFGYLIGPDGKALANVDVFYGPPLNKRPSDELLTGWSPNSSARVGIGIDLMRVMTDETGYFQMVVPANVPMRLKIDSVGHDFVYKTPGADSQSNFTELSEAVTYESYALNSDWENI